MSGRSFVFEEFKSPKVHQSEGGIKMICEESIVPIDLSRKLESKKRMAIVLKTYILRFYVQK